MQTFLAYSDFELSARILDDKRLNKQIVEGKQNFDTLKYGSRWYNHPAVKMWNKHELYLLEYVFSCYKEWQRRHFLGLRGGKLEHKTGEEVKEILQMEGVGSVFYIIPSWLEIVCPEAMPVRAEVQIMFLF